MKYLQSLVIAIPLAAVMAFAQDPPQNPPSSQQERQTQRSKPRTSESERSASTQRERRSGQADLGAGQSYTGNIVDANCSQASSLMPGSSSTTTSESKSKSASSAKRDVLRHCQPTSTTTSFALLTDDGNFYKLDETGNSKVTSEGLNKKNMKATVNGTVEAGTIKVQSISKM